MIRHLQIAAPLALTIALISGTHAQAAAPDFGGPVPLVGSVTFDPMLDARLRWEDVDATAKSADAVTLRLRSGAELKHEASGLSLLVEGEGTLALDQHYSAFPYANPMAGQYRPAQATIADPQNIELHRAQIGWQGKGIGLTLGRQRINLDDQRFVGSVGWRQNEQTFDAARATLAYGPLSLDATYADRQNTIYGQDGGARTAYKGAFYFLGAGVKTAYGAVKGFAYLLDYNKTPFSNAAARSQLDSSQTYGFRVQTMALKLAKGISLAASGSYANQSNYGNNIRHYSADYLTYEGALTIRDQVLTGGYEELGSDRNATGGAWAFQTPMATLHKFNGWADLFLTTPANGLADTYVGLAGKFPKLKALPSLTYAAAYHWYGSTLNDQKYGDEFNAQIGFRRGKINWLVKYADYQAKGFGVDTKKFWLQAEYAF